MCSVISVWIRRYTQRVHIAGTQANNRLRDTLRHQLQQLRHLRVKLYSYNALLSYPDWSVQHACCQNASSFKQTTTGWKLPRVSAFVNCSLLFGRTLGIHLILLLPYIDLTGIARHFVALSDKGGLNILVIWK